MTTETKDTEKLINHPLEETFDIEENTTVVPYKEVKTEVVEHKPYDPKDVELDEQFQEVYDSAFEAFENTREDIEMIDPKYKARNSEVAVQYLNTALAAAKEKSTLKQHSDKVVLSENKITSGPAGNGDNVIVDRNELLRALQDKAAPKEDITDAEFSEVKPEDD